MSGKGLRGTCQPKRPDTRDNIELESFPTDAKIDATYNYTPLEPKPRFSVDKPNPAF